MNIVIITGNLARDPIIRSTKTGRAVASFTIGTSRLYTTPQGEQRTLTDWINVVAWGAVAETVGNFCRKGTYVMVEGRIGSRSWDDQNGQRHWVTEVTANTVSDPKWGGEQKQPYGTSTPSNQKGDFSQFGEPAKESHPMEQGACFPESGPGEEIPF